MNGAQHSVLMVDKFDIDSSQSSDPKGIYLAWRGARKLYAIELIPWIEEHAPKIVREFYDWQFKFPQTQKVLRENGDG